MRALSLLLLVAFSALGCARAQGPVAPAPPGRAAEAQPGEAASDEARPDQAGTSEAGPGRWEALARQSADPLAPRLATYLRIVAGRSAVDPATVARFMAEAPGWPNRALMARMVSDGIAASANDDTVLQLCGRGLAGSAAARLRCAEAFRRAGQEQAAAAAARAAWESGLDDPATESAFLAAWSGAVNEAAQVTRFDRLAGGDAAAATRQAMRLDPGTQAGGRAEAQARLALRRDELPAAAMVAALGVTQRRDPALVLDWLRFLRRQDPGGSAALAGWRQDGDAAERAASAAGPERDAAALAGPGLAPAFAEERERLARRLLRAGDAAGALWLVEGEARSGIAAAADRPGQGDAGTAAEAVAAPGVPAGGSPDTLSGAAAPAAGPEPAAAGSGSGATAVAGGVAAALGTTAAPGLEAEFLAGWISLRRLGDPAAAARHFTVLAAGSHTATSLARAHYWLGRAAGARAASDAGTAREAAAASAAGEYAAAAAWPVTFYGQLALRAGGGDEAVRARIASLHDPAWTPEQALAFSGSELARATELLVAWGERRRARAFLLQLGDTADPRQRALAAALALEFGVPQAAVFAARAAGRAGGMLPRSGWPLAIAGLGTAAGSGGSADPAIEDAAGDDAAGSVAGRGDPGPGLEPAVVLGVARQESSFDAGALSPTGARGLMQLMPATAREVAHRLGTAVSVAALTANPALNVRLGSAYFAGLLEREGGVLPYAAAAYNAGPGRLREWLAADDPAAAGGDMVDWIEMIPVTETRGYVQRVIENVVDYRARLGVAAPHPLARWLG